MNKNNNFLETNNQDIINYYYKVPENNLPTIVFLPGYMSNINCTKSTFLKELSIKYGHGYLTLDYRGHGESSGKLENYSLEDWFNDVVLIINNFSKHTKKILVGSSMGGWLAFLYATRYSHLVSAIVGIAPALDFTEDLKNSKDTLLVSKENKNIFYLKEALIPNTPISKNLLQIPEKFLMLKATTINLYMPVRLLHGMLDNIVNYTKSLEISNKLLSDDVIVTLIKNGDHSLSKTSNLDLLKSSILDLTNII